MVLPMWNDSRKALTASMEEAEVSLTRWLVSLDSPTASKRERRESPAREAILLEALNHLMACEASFGSEHSSEKPQKL
jgi:hypothetical protein